LILTETASPPLRETPSIYDSQPVDHDVAEHDFIGRWHNGSGSLISRPFRNSLASDQVEFSDDATIILTARNGNVTTAIWRISADGEVLIADDNVFTIEVDRNVLTITDASGRERWWQRAE